MIKIAYDELTEELVGKPKKFPKYVSFLINRANRFSQATRPKVVGQLSELIQERPFRSFEEWKTWYLTQKPSAIDEATKKIIITLANIEDALNKIDEKMVREWVEDLVLVKTFVGFRFQSVILKRVASRLGKDYRLATPEEESKGIDGFIDNIPISVKPITYKLESLKEKIVVPIVFYEKEKDGIKIDMSQVSKVLKEIV